MRGAFSLDRRANSGEQIARPDGLRQKLDCPRLHRAHRHRDAAVSGDENDRDLYAGSRQLMLEIQAAETRQADIEDEAGGPLQARVVEELLRGRERPDVESHGTNQALGRPSDRWV